MAAMPAAPAASVAEVFSSVIPPSARTGVGAAAAQAMCSRLRPMPSEIWVSPELVALESETTFSKTGPKRIRLAAASRARGISLRVWQETLTIGSGRPAEA